MFFLRMVSQLLLGRETKQLRKLDCCISKSEHKIVSLCHFSMEIREEGRERTSGYSHCYGRIRGELERTM